MTFPVPRSSGKPGSHTICCAQALLGLAWPRAQPPLGSLLPARSMGHPQAQGDLLRALRPSQRVPLLSPAVPAGDNHDGPRGHPASRVPPRPSTVPGAQPHGEQRGHRRRPRAGRPEARDLGMRPSLALGHLQDPGRAPRSAGLPPPRDWLGSGRREDGSLQQQALRSERPCPSSAPSPPLPAHPFLPRGPQSTFPTPPNAAHCPVLPVPSAQVPTTHTGLQRHTQ